MAIKNTLKKLIVRWDHRWDATPHLSDIKQKWWELASIQIVGAASIPVFFIGTMLSTHLGMPSAIFSIIIGNIIIAAIGLPIVIISFNKRLSTLELAKKYVGQLGGLAVGALLIFSTLSWIPPQIQSANLFIQQLREDLGLNGINDFLSLPIALGFLCALIGCFGIKGIRWFSVVAGPLVIVIMMLFTTKMSWRPSDVSILSVLSGLPYVIGVALTRVVDLPTFFRHSKSMNDSIKGVLATILFLTIIEIFGALLETGNGTTMYIWANSYIAHLSKSGIYLSVLFILITTTNAIITNIYGGSVGWEILVPKVIGKQEYFIIGLIGIAFHSLFKQDDIFTFLIEHFDLILSGLLGMILGSWISDWKLDLTSIMRHPPRCFEAVNILAWAVGIILVYAAKRHIIELQGQGSTLAFVACLFFSLQTFYVKQKIIRSSHK